MKKIIEKLKSKNKTISCMESCTGGLLASEITNIDGASEVFKLGLVTYSNNAKIKFGVSQEILEKHTVYSKETSQEMAKVISKLSASNYGIGITGNLGTVDPNNVTENFNTVFVSIYNKDLNINYSYKINPRGKNKYEKKYSTIEFIKEKLISII